MDVMGAFMVSLGAGAALSFGATSLGIGFWVGAVVCIGIPAILFLAILRCVET